MSDSYNEVVGVAGSENHIPGWVYIVQSPCIHHDSKIRGKCACPVKIGAAKDLDNRLGTLNTAVPCEFNILMAVRCSDCFALEGDVHKDLQQIQIGKSEFFDCDIKEAKQALLAASARFKKERHGKVFEIKYKHVQLGRSAAARRTNRAKLFGSDGKEPIVFECRGNGLVASKMVCRGEHEFVIQKGSRICLTPSKSFLTSKPLSYGKRWAEAKNKLNERKEVCDAA